MINTLTQLENLWFNENPGLTGALPSLSGMFLLKQVQFKASSHTGGLSGAIPSEYGLLVNLEKLYLEGHSISGTIPTEFGRLTKLFDLRLGYNSIGGAIPTQIALMSKLAKFDISHNSITGNLPVILGTMTSLNELYVNGNPSLGGIMPNEIGNIPKLYVFDFSNCKFQCIFPEFLGNLSRGIVFDSRNNSGFYCPIPASLATSTAVDPCVPFTMDTQSTTSPVATGNVSQCDKNSSTTCTITVTGSNLQLAQCNVVVTVSSYDPITGDPVLNADVQFNPWTSVSGTISLGGPSTSTVLSAISAGPKLLQAKIKDTSTNPATYWSIGTGTFLPFISVGLCTINCGSFGICNIVTEQCDCYPGFSGTDCSYACDEPYVNLTTGVECNGHGTCSQDGSGASFCSCDTCDCNSPAGCWGGQLCNIPTCGCLDCSQSEGHGFCSAGKCACYSPFYTDPNCDPAEYTTGGRCQGCTLFDTPTCNADGWTGDYNTTIGYNVSCVCLPKYRGLLCDEKEPEQWPIIVGCVLGGVLLIGIGIFFFLKFKKFDPEKKRQEMEMKALNG